MNKEKFMLYYSFIINTLVLFVLVFGGIVLADSNGVWNRAEDVRGGTFGNDEQDVSASLGFIFKNQLTVQNDLLLTTSSLLNCNGKLITDSTGKVICGIDSGGVVSPPVCSGDNALQWTGTAWGCKSFTPSAPACTNTCSVGQLTCGGTGSNYIISCGDYNGDGCTEWSSSGTYCNYGCVGGVCNSGTYNFEYSSWGSCSASCGPGTQTRTAVCKDNLGNTVADSLCGTPTLSQSCDLGSCALNCQTLGLAGGEWVTVPGNSDSLIATSDFCVMKYEAKFVTTASKVQDATYKTWKWTGSSGDMAITSSPTYEPIGYITFDLAKSACNSLGSKYHLITNAEWTTIARDMEPIASNWNSGVGSSLYLGHSDSAPLKTLAVTNANDGYSDTGNSGTSLQRRTMYLSNGEIIWDLTGNMLEWVDYSTPAQWYRYADPTTSAPIYISWTNSNLIDYEKPRAGPVGAYSAGGNGAGAYYTSATNGYPMRRGGFVTAISGSQFPGIYTLFINAPPTTSTTWTGFRCVYTP